MQYLLSEVNDNFDNLIDFQTVMREKKNLKQIIHEVMKSLMCFQYKNGPR